MGRVAGSIHVRLLSGPLYLLYLWLIIGYKTCQRHVSFLIVLVAVWV